MRIVPATLAIALLFAGPAAAQRADIPAFNGLNRAAPDRCAPTAGIVDYRDRKAPPLKLGDQPPASQFYAVYNVVDGCPKPIVLRKGIGNNPDAAKPVLRTPPRITRAAHAD